MGSSIPVAIPVRKMKEEKTGNLQLASSRLERLANPANPISPRDAAKIEKAIKKKQENNEAELKKAAAKKVHEDMAARLMKQYQESLDSATSDAVLRHHPGELEREVWSDILIRLPPNELFQMRSLTEAVKPIAERVLRDQHIPNMRLLVTFTYNILETAFHGDSTVTLEFSHFSKENSDVVHFRDVTHQPRFTRTEHSTREKVRDLWVVIEEYAVKHNNLVLLKNPPMVGMASPECRLRNNPNPEVIDLSSWFQIHKSAIYSTEDTQIGINCPKRELRFHWKQLFPILVPQSELEQALKTKIDAYQMALEPYRARGGRDQRGNALPQPVLDTRVDLCHVHITPHGHIFSWSMMDEGGRKIVTDRESIRDGTPVLKCNPAHLPEL